MAVFNHMSRQRIWIDAAASAAIGNELDRRGAKRAFVMCSATLNRHGAAGSMLIAALGDRIVGMFDGVSEHTPLASVLTAMSYVTDNARKLAPSRTNGGTDLAA